MRIIGSLQSTETRYNRMPAKPEWLKRKIPVGDFSKIKHALRSRGLVTVCEESHCPNMSECWQGQGTATFMVMGDTCTRGCQFCAVSTGVKGQPLDPHEPQKLADAIAEMELDYAVITSVDRDDLLDGGASHFSQCISAVKKAHPKTNVEVLIPDFAGNYDALRKVVLARPEVIAHNIETVRRLVKGVRDRRANTDQSLTVLKQIKSMNSEIYTKSAIMVGLGETKEEVVEAMQELRDAGVDILTIGQYMKPKNKRLSVEEYVHPDVYAYYETKAKELGFLYCAAGPFVRSSYRAGEFFIKSLLAQKTPEETHEANSTEV
jgi:lipoic acid synthetase